MIAINMKMPENCFVCRFRNEYDACVASAISPIDGDAERPDWCPLLNVEKVMAERIIPHEDVVLVSESELMEYATEKMGKGIGKLILGTDGLHQRRIREVETKGLTGDYWLGSKIIRETCWVVEIGKEKNNE